MAAIVIESKGCRSCSLCQEVCPTEVFDLEPTSGVALAARSADCIGCLSCEYICPSRCLTVTEIQRQRPFHRVEEDAALVARFLQRTPNTVALGAADLGEALRDVGVRLGALGASVVETMGRGYRAVGRRSGKLAAEHLPEMYEGRDLEAVLARLQRRFAGGFDFNARVEENGERIEFEFEHCAIESVVTGQGQAPGEAVLCVLLHEYWAGLVGEFARRSYQVEAAAGGRVCAFRLRARGEARGESRK